MSIFTYLVITIICGILSMFFVRWLSQQQTKPFDVGLKIWSFIAGAGLSVVILGIFLSIQTK